MYYNYSLEIHLYSEVQSHKILNIFKMFPQISLLKDI